MKSLWARSRRTGIEARMSSNVRRSFYTVKTVRPLNLKIQSCTNKYSRAKQRCHNCASRTILVSNPSSCRNPSQFGPFSQESEIVPCSLSSGRNFWDILLIRNTVLWLLMQCDKVKLSTNPLLSRDKELFRWFFYKALLSKLEKLEDLQYQVASRWDFATEATPQSESDSKRITYVINALTYYCGPVIIKSNDRKIPQDHRQYLDNREPIDHFWKVGFGTVAMHDNILMTPDVCENLQGQ